MEIDYGLLPNGIIVTNDYVSVVTDGTFHLPGESEPTHKQYTKMPVHVDGAQELQIMISEYSINQILANMVRNDVFHYDTNQTSDNVDAIVTEFEKVFGDPANVTVTVEAVKNLTKYEPNIKISRAGSLIEFYVEIHIRNPLSDYKMDAAYIVAKTLANVSFSVNDALQVIGFMNTLELTILEFEPYFQTKTTLSDIVSRLSPWIPMMQSYANDLLDNGLSLAIPQNISRYILNEKLTPMDGFLLIDGNADFTQNFTLAHFIKEKRWLQGAEWSDRDREQAQDNFYGLVEKVYVHKMKHDTLNQDNYQDVLLAVNDIMDDYNNMNKNMSSPVTNTWGEDMKEQHQQVISDLKSGKLQWKDISLTKIGDIGAKILDQIENEVDELFTALKRKFLDFGRKDLDELEKVESKVEGFVDTIFSHFGGSRL